MSEVGESRRCVQSEGSRVHAEWVAFALQTSCKVHTMLETGRRTRAQGCDVRVVAARRRFGFSASIGDAAALRSRSRSDLRQRRSGSGPRPAVVSLKARGYADGEDWGAVKAVPVRNPDEAAVTSVVVLGGGSFGTALGALFAKNGYQVTLLVRSEEVAQSINDKHVNAKFFPEFELPHTVKASTNAAEVLPTADLLVHAVPVQATRAFLTDVAKHMRVDTPVLCTSKGLEVRELKLMCELLPEVLGKKRPLAYLSGPSFAREMMEQLPTAVVVASKDARFAQRLAMMLSSPCFRVFMSKDVVGLEVAGAVKNVIAIAAGLCEGLGLGTNAVAALVTRGCSEMRRVAVERGGQPVTLSGLSGVGDAFLTCFGPLSRNRTVGVRLGRGESLQCIVETSREVAEGVQTASALVRWLAGSSNGANPYASRACVKFPILFGVAAILEGRITPNEGMQNFLAMPPKAED